MNPYKTFLFFFGLTLFLTGCQSSWQQPLPDGDIVYMPYYKDLGFIQPNGENNQTVEIDRRLSKPVWSNDGKIIFGLSGSGQAGAYSGHPAYWDLDEGRYRICEGDLPFYDQIQGMSNVENPYEVILLDTWDIVVMDLSTCKQVQTIVDYSAHPADYDLAGFSFSPTTNALVYGLVVTLNTTNPKDREYRIMRVNIDTHEQVHLADGINPVWSPDGTQIAYLSTDGLNVMSSGGSDAKKWIDQPFYDAWASGSPWYFAPFLHWSPDGEWLIYHRCDTDKICITKDVQIYKFRLSDGLEAIIVQGGAYPSWRNK